jgi:peptidoglycan/xylan/chitin deacetylase (PgdA/CDA1 family)
VLPIIGFLDPVAILTYHHIGNCPPEQLDHPGLWVSPELFASQLQWLKDHQVVGLPLDEIQRRLVAKARFPEQWVSITFDDGWLDNLIHAAPLLEEFGYRASVFMITSKIRSGERGGAWDDYLSADELRDLSLRGHYIGNHTHSHPRLTSLDNESICEEFRRSRQILNDVLCENGASGKDQDGGQSSPGSWLCYPYGNFSPRIARLAQDAGFTGALSTIRDNRLKAEQMYWLPRVMVMGDTLPARFAYLLSSRYHWLHAFKNRKRWRSIR